MDVVGEESIVPGKGTQRSAKWGLSNRSDEYQDVRKMREVWEEMCVPVDRLTRSLEAVQVMLGVPPLLHNRRFA